MRCYRGSSDQRRGGFTLVELLVVIAIIGVLVALLLPAIQAAREAARRAQCSNNFRQVGVAIHNHLSATKEMPLGEDYYNSGRWINSCGEVSNKTLRDGGSWSVYILPYLEQEGLDGQFDHSLLIDSTTPNPSGASNFQLCAIHINTYLCPSDPQSGQLVESSSFSQNGSNPDEDVSHTSMCAVADSNDQTCGGVVIRQFGGSGAEHVGGETVLYANGAFGNIHAGRPGQYVDGLSNTLFVGEVLGEGSDTYHGHFWITHNLLSTFDGINGPNTVIGGTWPPPFTTGQGGSQGYRRTGFASYHPSGCHFLLGDGSVKFLNEEISPQALAAMTTRAGGEPVEP